MTVVKVEIDQEGDSKIWVMNTREDLRDDLNYFITEAAARSDNEPESIFLRQRFLRAALLSLFAYADAVISGWLYSLSDSDQRGALLKRMKNMCLEKKIEELQRYVSGVIQNPDVKNAKQVRNLLVHFAPGQDPTDPNKFRDLDDSAFEKLTLVLVEDARMELNRWMTEMELALGIKRHENSAEIMRAFDELGTTTKSVSSS